MAWLGLWLRLRVLREAVAPWPRAEHAARVERHENRRGHELGCDVERVEGSLRPGGVLCTGTGREERRRRVADDDYTVHADDGL